MSKSSPGFLSSHTIFFRVTITGTNHHDQKQSRENRAYLAYIEWTTVHWGKPGQELKQGGKMEAGANAVIE